MIPGKFYYIKNIDGSVRVCYCIKYEFAYEGSFSSMYSFRGISGNVYLENNSTTHKYDVFREATEEEIKVFKDYRRLSDG